MRQTRSSVRLAKAAVKPELGVSHRSRLDTNPKASLSRVKKEMEPHDTDFEDTKEEDDDFEEHEVPAPKRKRARTARTAKSAPRKRQVRGKQGRLEGLMRMPIDIFAEIALHLMPKDIIMLSRSSKFFRSLLMNRSAIHIWHGSMRNVPGLPPCPPDMSEPRYLTLIYGRNCSMCGGNFNRRMDEILRVRLCPECRNKSLISIAEYPFELHDLVLHSNKIMPSKRRWHLDAHALKSDVDEVQAKIEELRESEDQSALEKWKETRRQELDGRRKQATELIVFLNGIDLDRDAELSGLRRERKAEIHRRLLELGWEKEDLKFPYLRGRDWDTLVEQPRPLTNRTWENLRPKLIPLLEANREDRLKREKEERKRARRGYLSGCLSQIKDEREPLLDLTIRIPTIPSNASSSNASSNAEPSTTHIKHVGIFPDIVDALEWDTMKHLLEEDLLVADLSERVDMVLPEIKEETNGWINNVETHLAELIRKGREEDELDAEIPELTLPVAGDSTTDPFESVTSGQKLLLRADSLFMSNRIGGLPPPVVYDALIADGYRSQVTNPFQFMRPTKAPLDLGKFKRHPEAQAAARILLEHLGKPNATFLEMKSAGKSYMCGRCHDIITYSWEELVQHYLQHKQTWGQAQKQQGELTRRGVTFRNVHNPAFETNKPMVKIVSKEEGITAVSNLLQGMNIKACNVCHKFTFLPPVRGSEEKIIEHVRDVHNISEPKSPEHYAAPFYGLHYGSMFDVDDDMYDSYYDSDSDMWDDPFDAYDMYDMYDMYNMHGGYGGGMDSDDGSLGW